MDDFGDKRGLSEIEAAEYSGISRSTLRQGRMNGIRCGRVPPPPFIRLGRKILYLRDDLDNWLEAHRVDLIEGDEVADGNR